MATKSSRASIKPLNQNQNRVSLGNILLAHRLGYHPFRVHGNIYMRLAQSSPGQSISVETCPIAMINRILLREKDYLRPTHFSWWEAPEKEAIIDTVWNYLVSQPGFKRRYHQECFSCIIPFDHPIA